MSVGNKGSANRRLDFVCLKFLLFYCLFLWTLKTAAEMHVNESVKKNII